MIISAVSSPGMKYHQHTHNDFTQMCLTYLDYTLHVSSPWFLQGGLLLEPCHSNLQISYFDDEGNFWDCVSSAYPICISPRSYIGFSQCIICTYVVEYSGKTSSFFLVPVCYLTLIFRTLQIIALLSISIRLQFRVCSLNISLYH